MVWWGVLTCSARHRWEADFVPQIWRCTLFGKGVYVVFADYACRQAARSVEKTFYATDRGRQYRNLSQGRHRRQSCAET